MDTEQNGNNDGVYFVRRVADHFWWTMSCAFAIRFSYRCAIVTVQINHVYRTAIYLPLTIDVNDSTHIEVFRAKRAKLSSTFIISSIFCIPSRSSLCCRHHNNSWHIFFLLLSLNRITNNEVIAGYKLNASFPVLPKLVQSKNFKFTNDKCFDVHMWILDRHQSAASNGRHHLSLINIELCSLNRSYRNWNWSSMSISHFKFDLYVISFGRSLLRCRSYYSLFFLILF